MNNKVEIYIAVIGLGMFLFALYYMVGDTYKKVTNIETKVELLIESQQTYTGTTNS